MYGGNYGNRYVVVSFDDIPACLDFVLADRNLRLAGCVFEQLGGLPMGNATSSVLAGIDLGYICTSDAWVRQDMAQIHARESL